jgi:phytoene dehydrogenase-like protein
VARSTLNTAGLERLNPNLVGGDITGGAQVLSQIFTRPAVRWDPYTTPLKHVYLCSASTPPGAGIHGMCGSHAAESYLRAL